MSKSPSRSRRPQTASERGPQANESAAAEQNGDENKVATTQGQTDPQAPPPDFPAVAEGSGLRKNMFFRANRIDPANVVNPNKDAPNDMVNRPERQETRPLGHPNRTTIEETVADHLAPANRPFGSQPQNIDPGLPVGGPLVAASNVLPMDSEERRTGVPREEGEPEPEPRTPPVPRERQDA